MRNLGITKKSIIIAVITTVFMITHARAAEINIVQDELSPQPVEPGQDFVMSITLVNEGSDVKGVTLTIVPDSVIILKNDNNRVIYERSIIRNGGVKETYQLHVDPRAVSGVYGIEFRTHWLSNDIVRETNQTFNVMVRGVPQLAISNITVNPELISPKDTFNIMFSVSNQGSGVARQVQISAETNELPFVPVGADTEIIKELNPGELNQLNYRALVKDKAEISSYSIPIKMNYKDESGRNISSQSFVGIRVLGRAELAIANIKTEPQNPVQGDAVTVTMRIENSGNGDAKSVKVNLNIPFEGTKTAYLGKIKPNDDAPAVFSILANESGDIPYLTAIEFEDDLGMRSTTQTLNLHVRAANKNGFISPLIVAAIVAGAALYYLYRRKKYVK